MDNILHKGAIGPFNTINKFVTIRSAFLTALVSSSVLAGVEAEFKGGKSFDINGSETDQRYQHQS